MDVTAYMRAVGRRLYLPESTAVPIPNIRSLQARGVTFDNHCRSTLVTSFFFFTCPRSLNPLFLLLSLLGRFYCTLIVQSPSVVLFRAPAPLIHEACR